MPRIEGEETAPVLKDDARIPGDDGRAEIMIDALNKADGAAFSVHDAEPYGVACGIHGLHMLSRLLHADARGLIAAVLRREQKLQGNIQKSGIREPAIPVRKGFLGGLHQEMVVSGCALSEGGHIEIFKDIKNFERRHALGIGRQVEGRTPAVAHRYGLHPVSRV